RGGPSPCLTSLSAGGVSAPTAGKAAEEGVAPGYIGKQPVPSVPPRSATVTIAERDRNKPMLGKGKSSGSNRRNLGKRRKYNIAEEVTTFATPDERALAVKCTALAGSRAVGAGAVRGAKSADAAGLFNEGVLDNVLTTDEQGKPLLQLQRMTTGPALNRFWETMSKGIYGPLHDGSGS
ncbi:unnamed protein product, partial [Laminaria digitata]